MKLPQAGLDLSSGARAGLEHLRGRRRPPGRRGECHHQQSAAGRVRHRPAAIDPGRGGEAQEHQRGEAKAERIASVPAERIGDPAEFGAACAFLCSAQAGYITGQNLVIDGGAFPGAF